MKITTRTLIGLALPLLAATSFAGTMEDSPEKNSTGSKFYVQGDAGISIFQKYEGNQEETEKNFAYDIKAGLLFPSSTMARFGAKVGYVNLGSQKLLFPYYLGPITGSIKQSGFDALAVINADISDKTSFVAKLGGAYITQKIERTWLGKDRPMADSKKLLLEGALGLHYNINERVALAGEWRFINSDKDAGKAKMPIVASNSFSLGIKVNLA